MIGELYRQELQRLLARRFAYVLVLLVVAAALARMVVLAQAEPASALEVPTAPQLWAEGMAWALRFSVFVLLVLGAMSFSQEFSLGTVKTVLVLPVRRGAWLAAKLGALVTVAWVLWLAVAGLGVLVAALTLGWGDVAREGFVMHEAAAVWRQVALAVALTAVLLVPLCVFALWLGLWFSSSGAAVGVAVLAGMVLEAVAGLFEAGRLVFLQHLHAPAAVVGRLGRGLPYQWEPVLTWGLGTAAGTCLLFGLWAWWYLERRDITV